MELASGGVESTTRALLAYCRASGWAGYDPYDALNSGLFRALPFLDSRFPRLIVTQLLKRSPVNIRSLMLVPKTQNPKALGLFLSAFLKLSSLGVTREDCDSMIERLIATRSKGLPWWCWGYSFPWQMRTDLVPAGAPNLVCTTFVANALLDAYDEFKDPRCLEMAVSASTYIVDRLFWSDKDIASFSYPLPSFRSRCHNANLLAAALLCRVHKYVPEERFLGTALRVTTYSAGRQRADGSWLYGESAHQNWVDNFHTGYNLCALRSIARDARTTEFDGCIRRGFSFYRAHFIREDGAPGYFHNRVHPIDIHSVAQSIITLVAFQDLDPEGLSLAHHVLRWAMDNMWDSRGFFYYRKLRLCTIRTSYMRWSQAWMLLALSTLFETR